MDPAWMKLPCSRAVGSLSFLLSKTCLIPKLNMDLFPKIKVMRLDWNRAGKARLPSQVADGGWWWWWGSSGKLLKNRAVGDTWPAMQCVSLRSSGGCCQCWPEIQLPGGRGHIVLCLRQPNILSWPWLESYWIIVEMLLRQARLSPLKTGAQKKRTLSGQGQTVKTY